MYENCVMIKIKLGDREFQKEGSPIAILFLDSRCQNHPEGHRKRKRRLRKLFKSRS